jgi:hypothetical protein
MPKTDWNDKEAVRAYHREWQARHKGCLLVLKPEPISSEPKTYPPAPEPRYDTESWYGIETLIAWSEPNSNVGELARAEKIRRIRWFGSLLAKLGGDEVTIKQIHELLDRECPPEYHCSEFYIPSDELRGLMYHYGWYTPKVDGHTHLVYRRTERPYHTALKPLSYPWDYYALEQMDEVKELCQKAASGQIPAEQLRLGVISISQDEKHCQSRLAKCKRSGIWPTTLREKCK